MKLVVEKVEDLRERENSHARLGSKAAYSIVDVPTVILVGSMAPKGIGSSIVEVLVVYSCRDTDIGK
jgi:hypothetical protein